MALPAKDPPAKGSLVAFVQNFCGADQNLRRTYREMGWNEFVQTPNPSTDPFEVLGAFISHLCIDEDGFFNEFLHPIARVMPPFLKERGFTLNQARAAEISELLCSGDASAESIAALLRDIFQ